MSRYNITTNGRINLGTKSRNSVVSIYDNNFKTQVEEELWPCVDNLINKGYITVGSCSGHYEADISYTNELHISVIFNNKLEALDFIDRIKTPFILARFDDSYIFKLEWFNKNFIRKFNEMHIVTVYPIHLIISRNSLLKKMFLKHLESKIKSLCTI
jgi:hypothetical protein